MRTSIKSSSKTSFFASKFMDTSHKAHWSPTINNVPDKKLHMKDGLLIREHASFVFIYVQYVSTM